MSELKINCIYIGQYGSDAEVYFGEIKLQVDFDDQTIAEISAIALDFVQRKQRALAEEISSAKPLQLIDASVPEAEFTSVEF